MMYLVLKFLHVGSMFLGTALAIGPIALFVLILRTGDAHAIRRAFRFAEPLSRAGGVFYGLGVIFGVITALNGGIDLTAPWLVTAYALLVGLIVTNLYADRWMKRVHVAAEAASEETGATNLNVWRRASGPIWSLGVASMLTLALVFVMVVKPTLF
jgi:uncharacterized membrane protein